MSISLDDYTITLHDPKQDTDAEIAERVTLANALSAEVFPEDPPTPVAQAIAHLRAAPERIRRWSFRARDAQGNLVAVGGTDVDPDRDDNPDVLFVEIGVDRAHRRRGVGARILGELATLARAEGRTRLVGDTLDGLSGSVEFAEAMGGVTKIREHINHLPIVAVDRDVLEAWVAESHTRAGDYELLGFDGPVPDDLLETFTELVLVMNTAPRENLEIEDFTLTPEQMREMERQTLASGLENWTLLTRHIPTGELVGYHDVWWNPAQPAVVWVGGTGVQPAHRGHALGKWLKAAMTLRILDERPTVDDIRTGNADSNDAMLGINKLMGYRGFMAATTWELEVEGLGRILAARGG